MYKLGKFIGYDPRAKIRNYIVFYSEFCRGIACGLH